MFLKFMDSCIRTIMLFQGKGYDPDDIVLNFNIGQPYVDKERKL